MTRALIVTPIYPVPDNPHAGIFVHRQILGLRRTGVDCRVITFRPGPPAFPRWLVRRSWLQYRWRSLGWPRELDGVPVDVVFYRQPHGSAGDIVPEIAGALARHIEASPALHGTEVIYSHWYWTGGAVALSLRERYGWPVAAICRGSDMHLWQELYPHCRPHVERVIREADAVLANCGDLRDRAEALVPGASARIEVVYNGCDPNVFKPADDKEAVRRELGVESGTKVLLFCGDVSARKGIPELADAWADFSRRHGEWRIVVVGPTSEPGAEAALRRAADGRARFTGRLTRDKVVKWLQAADAYVQPSRLEGLANATMEAMAAQLPVVSTDTCGQKELIRDGEDGLLVPVNDPAALGRALSALAADPERALELGRAARRAIATRFDPRVEVARLARILSSLAGRGGAPMVGR